MAVRRRSIVTTALLTAGAIASVLATGHFGFDKLRTGSAAAAVEVIPVELVLLVDTSGSVDDNEYALQKLGYEKAFESDELATIITRMGGIAVTYIEWSNVDHQNVRIDWTKLDSPEDCRAFATVISKIERTETGGTRLAPALQFAGNSLATNAYVGIKRVIDVSGDGVGDNWAYYQNESAVNPSYGTPWSEVVSTLAGQVDQVNGICITTQQNVVDFYRDVVVQGNAGFMMQVDTFAGFEQAILDKLRREISVIPGLYD